MFAATTAINWKVITGFTLHALFGALFLLKWRNVPQNDAVGIENTWRISRWTGFERGAQVIEQFSIVAVTYELPVFFVVVVYEGPSRSKDQRKSWLSLLNYFPRRYFDVEHFSSVESCERCWCNLFAR